MVPRSNGETKYIMRDLKAISVEDWYAACMGVGAGQAVARPIFLRKLPKN